MQRLTIKLAIALIAGFGLTMICLGLMSDLQPRAPTASAANYTVCSDGPPTCAYTNVQAAVDAAVAGDIIKVVAGTYTGTNNYSGLTQMVYLSKSVTIQGGYADPTSPLPDPVTHPTILDAQRQGRVFYITGDISPTIAGLHLTGGEAIGLGGDPAYDAGGGLYVITAAAIIRHNYIYSNTVSPVTGVSGVGSGLYLVNSDALIEHNTIISNATYSGSGMYLESSPATIRSNLIADNNASHSGGGLSLVNSDVTVIKNEIISNTAGYGGGGIILGGSGTPLLKSNTVAGNRVGAVGGGVVMNTGAVIFDSNLIVNNLAGEDPTFGGQGGGLFLNTGEATLVNNIIVDNKILPDSSFDQGSGVFLQGSTGDFKHNTIAQNEGSGRSGVYVSDSSIVTLINTILVSHSTGIQVESGSMATLESTLWFGNGANWAGSGTINTNNDYAGDPAFSNPNKGDYHLQATSAALDKGIVTGVVDDIDGHPRDAAPDLGADERYEVVELIVAKSGPATATAGDPITYTLNITNLGGETATNLVITDTIPTGAVYLSGGTKIGNVVSWTLPNLAANGGLVQRSFVVTAAQSITNHDYAVRADGGAQAQGSVVVVTAIKADEDQLAPRLFLPVILK